MDDDGQEEEEEDNDDNMGRRHAVCPRHAAVSASGTRLWACLHLAQPSDATTTTWGAATLSVRDTLLSVRVGRASGLVFTWLSPATRRRGGASVTPRRDLPQLISRRGRGRGRRMRRRGAYVMTGGTLSRPWLLTRTASKDKNPDGVLFLCANQQ